MAVGNHKGNAVSQTPHQHRSFTAADHPDLDCFESPDQLHETNFRRCRYSSGVASVNQSGWVVTASPPSLVLPKKTTERGLLKPADQSDKIRLHATTLEHKETQANNWNEQRQAPGFSPCSSNLANHSSDNGTPLYHLAKSLHTDDFVPATPDEKGLESSSNEARLLKDAVQGRVLCFEELSPRLAEFAIHGVVPCSPGRETIPISGKVSVSSDLGTVSTKEHPYLPSNGEMHIPAMRLASSVLKPSSSIPPLPSTSLADKDAYSHCRSPVSGFAHPMADVSPKLRTLKVRPLTFDHRRTEKLPLPNQTILEGNKGNNPFKPAAENLSKAKAESPLQIPSSKSSGENWDMFEGEASASVQKPRQLKRLRRAREKLPLSFVEESPKRKHDRSLQKVKMNDSRSGRGTHA